MSTSNSLQTIEAEADTLQAARALIGSQIQTGFTKLSENILSYAMEKTQQAVGETVEEAFTIAEAGIPPHSEILEKKEITRPDRKTILLEAPNDHEAENSARFQARQQTGGIAKVESIKLIAAGSKGFLGIGEKPNQYQAVLFKEAVVEIRYKVKAKISVFVLPNDIYSAIRAEFTQLKQDKQTDHAVFEDVVEKGARRPGDLHANMANALVGSIRSGEYDHQVFTYIVKQLASKYGLSEEQIREIVRADQEVAQPQAAGGKMAEPAHSGEQ
jgi:hypothetical protein